MIAMTGTNAQLGTARIRVKTRIIGMLRITSMMLATNNEAIRPQTMSGCCWNSSGPGVMLYSDSAPIITAVRSEEHTSELQSLMRISYAVFCLKKKTKENIREIRSLK